MSAFDLVSLCREGDIDAVQQMIARKCDVNGEIDGLYPLLAAIESDDHSLASLLLAAGAALQLRSSALSPLRLAAARGSARVAELFICKGAEITIDDVVDAACSGHRALVALLARRLTQQTGASVLHLLPSGTQPDENPLHRAAVDLIIGECAARINALDSGDRTPLQRAATSGNAYVASALLRARADVDAASGTRGLSALMVAAEQGRVAVVAALLAGCPRVDAQDGHGNTALHRSVCSRSLAVTRALLEARADANIGNVHGRTPLFSASSAAVAGALLDAGADVNRRDADGRTPLFAANREVAAALISRGADVAAARRGQTLLMSAVVDRDVGKLRLLLASPGAAAVLDEVDGGGDTAIALAVRSNAPLDAVRMLVGARADVGVSGGGVPLLSLAANADTARVLLDAGADCNQQSRSGRTPLAAACLRGLADVVTVLLARGASVDISEADGWTPLMLAAQEGHLAVVGLLLRARSPTLLDARSEDGATALFVAVRGNFPCVVDALLAAGARLDVGAGGQTALMAAPDAEMAARLLDGGADVNARAENGATALLLAAGSGKDASLVALLLERGADVSLFCNRGWSPLLVAASKDRVNVMKLLLQAAGARAWVDAQAHDGATALIAASEYGATAAVEALLAAGADVHLTLSSGYTALHAANNADIARLLWGAGARDTLSGDKNTLMYACRRNKADVVEFLLQRGLDANAVHGDCTPLMRAAEDGHLGVLRLLLAAPVKVDQRNDSGHTALFLAVASDQTEAVKMLLEAKASPRAACRAGTVPLMHSLSATAVGLLVDAAPAMVNHVDGRGRRALAYLARHATLAALLSSSAEYSIPVDVNHADVNGDTALHMAMLRGAGPRAVKLLLEKGADVFSVGYGGTTVLMKPFLTVDQGVIAAKYADCEPYDGRSRELADTATSDCLEAVLDRALSRRGADDGARGGW